jgi:hypothetical protein
MPLKTSPKETSKVDADNEKTKQLRAGFHKQLRKTKFCMYHLQGACRFGTSCAFAHALTDMAGTPDLRKTQLCKNFFEGTCTDPTCNFAHGEQELRSTDLFFRKTLCIWNEKGKCRNGEKCRFAHGMKELRSDFDTDCAVGSAVTPNGKATKAPKNVKGEKAKAALTSAQFADEEPLKVFPLGGMPPEVARVPYESSAMPYYEQLATPYAQIDEFSCPAELTLSELQLQLLNVAQQAAQQHAVAQQVGMANVDRRSLQMDLDDLRKNVASLTLHCTRLQESIDPSPDFLQSNDGYFGYPGIVPAVPPGRLEPKQVRAAYSSAP